MPSVTIDLRQFLNQSHTGIAYNKKEGLIQPLRRFFIPLYRTFVLSAVFLLGLLRGGISLDAPADRFGVIWIPSVNEISKPYFDFAGFFGLHFRSKKSPENQGFFQLVALDLTIDTRCIFALAGALKRIRWAYKVLHQPSITHF